VSVKKAIESLLENDLDMADLYLSEGQTFFVYFGKELFIGP